ncbi:MAG: helix-turn-helix domain-containing protein [Woeseia sp.]
MTTTEFSPRRAAYTIQEARHLLGGVSQATIYKLINNGKLRTYRQGRRRFVSGDAIAEYVRTAERETGAA